MHTYRSVYILKICDPGPQNLKFKLSRWGIFVAMAKNTLYGSKWLILLILLMPKIIKTLSKETVKYINENSLIENLAA